jgi:transposase InsO family protein
MEEKQKIDIAVFRFSVIHDFVDGRRLSRNEKKKLIQEKCARKWMIPYSEKSSISPSTIRRWIKLYQDSGNKLAALYPKTRKDRGQTRVLAGDLCLVLLELRSEFPDETIPFILKTMKQRGIIHDITDVSLSTLYRFYHQHDLMRRQPVIEDRRRYEAQLPNDIWQSDVMHGPRVHADGKNRKTYLIAFLDDHSRLIPFGAFYTSESARTFLNALEQALLKRGVPRKLYTDNGSAFRSRQLMHTTASLGIALVHSPPYKPEGRGKIERFFRTVRSQCLPGFTGNTLPELNDHFDQWMSDDYHTRKHSATGQSPLRRFIDNIECVRSAPENLRDHFRKVARRRVNKDRSVVLDRRLYEAPVALIGKQVVLLYHDEDRDTIEVRWKDQSYGLLVRVDVNVNCRVRRDKNSNIALSGNPAPPSSGQVWEVS